MARLARDGLVIPFVLGVDDIIVTIHADGVTGKADLLRRRFLESRGAIVAELPEIVGNESIAHGDKKNDENDKQNGEASDLLRYSRPKPCKPTKKIHRLVSAGVETTR
jgi:hypothetical protein